LSAGSDLLPFGSGASGVSVPRESRITVTVMIAKKNKMAATIHKLTFVVRRWTFTAGNPVLSLSIDME